MNAETIKSFLVSLGFSVDESGARKFDAVLTGVTKTAIGVGLAVEGAALSVVAFTAKIAAGMDNLYWASQRTGATVKDIQAVSYAISQTGGSADAAKSSLESLARFVRNNPGAEGFLNRLGVQTRDASGNMKDMASIFTGVGQKLSKMPYYRANQYAQMLGIDENTLMAMRRGIGGFTAQYSAMTKAIGFNADRAAAQSNRFMTSIRAFGEMAGLARDKIGSDMAGSLAGAIDTLRKRILDNFPKVEGGIVKLIKGLLWLADVINHVVYRMITGVDDITKWWGTLDRDTKTLIETLGGLVVVMKLLNSTFWMSPIGLITALAGAILLLWDDYKTWKEGGNSLIDWSKWEPTVEKLKGAIKWLRDGLLKLKDGMGGWQKTFEALGTYIAGAWVVKVLGAFAKISRLPIPPWLKLWGVYAAYLYSDRKNIKDSAQSSWDYTKGNIGDAMRWLGIDTDFGKNPNTVEGDNIQSDIPGAEPEPVQHAQSVKRHHTALPDRNNNPGNLRPVNGDGYRVFQSAYAGWEAMKNQLMRYYTGKTTGHALRTVADIVSTWAPAADHNDPKGYAANVARWMGVSPTAVLNLTNPNTMAALMQSMAHQEGYSQWNSPQANQVAGGKGAPTLQQTNTYHIYGGNAHEIGNEVERRSHDSTARVMRTEQPKVG